MNKKKARRSRRMFISAGLLSVALVSASVVAQLPPLSTGDKNFPKALVPVVEAEHAFALHSIEHGMKEAFLSFAAPDGLIVRRSPVNAIEAWTKTTPAPTGLLTWYPIFADVSRAGDLGYTTGPWEFRDKPDDKEASGNGHFITLWRKQPDGAWKFEMDMGISHAAPVSKETVLTYPPSTSKSAGKGDVVVDMSASRTSLLDAEHSLAKDVSAKGSARAFLERVDKNIRLYREHELPFVGIEAVRRSLEARTDAVTWQTTKANVARSGDLGYAYGTYELKAKSADAKPSENGNYMRIWKRQGGKWRVVLEVATPVPLRQ